MEEFLKDILKAHLQILNFSEGKMEPAQASGATKRFVKI